MSIDVNCTAWRGFKTGEWRHVVNVRNFIQKNYMPYAGGDGFLEGTTEKTKKVWEKAHGLILEEVKKGIVDVDTTVVSGIDNFAPGYIDKDNEVIVGLQTDAPLKRIVNPFGGMRMAKSALEQYGYQLDPDVEKHFNLFPDEVRSISSKHLYYKDISFQPENNITNLIEDLAIANTVKQFLGDEGADDSED